METLVGDGGKCEMQKLSEEEQRVCVLKEVEKYNESESGDGGLFAWLGGIGMSEEPEKVIVQPDATVEELWRRLLQYEQSRGWTVCCQETGHMEQSIHRIQSPGFEHSVQTIRWHLLHSRMHSLHTFFLHDSQISCK